MKPLKSRASSLSSHRCSHPDFVRLVHATMGFGGMMTISDTTRLSTASLRTPGSSMPPISIQTRTCLWITLPGRAEVR